MAPCGNRANRRSCKPAVAQWCGQAMLAVWTVVRNLPAVRGILTAA